MAFGGRKCLIRISERFLCERAGRVLIAGFVFLILSGIFFIMRYYLLRRWELGDLAAECEKHGCAWSLLF